MLIRLRRFFSTKFGPFANLIVVGIPLLALCVNGLPSYGQNGPDPDPPWGDPEAGLRCRILVEKSVWKNLEQPQLEVQVRNATDQTVTAGFLREHLFQRESLMLLQEPPEVVGERKNDLEVMSLQDLSGIGDLKPAEVLSIPVRVVSLSQAARSSSFEKGLKCDRLRIGLGKRLGRNETRFHSNLVTIELLPPGADSIQELERHLQPFEVGDQKFRAGFVPATKTFVMGEQLNVSFLVRNNSTDPFQFIFGGDYRAANRHNRFRVEARDESNRMLIDPGAAFGDMGGITWHRSVDSGRTTTEELDLSKYRTFPGPGRYSVSIEFDVAGDHQERNLETVAGDFQITIQPRTRANVERVLDRLFRQMDQTRGETLTQLVTTISDFGKEFAVAGFSKRTSDGPIEAREAAIVGLSRIDDPDALATLLSIDPDGDLQGAAIDALGAFSDEKAVTRVIAAISDERPAVAKLAIRSLGRMKTKNAIDALLKTYSDADDVEQKKALISALGESQSDFAVPVVSKALADNNSEIRSTAVEAILKFDTARAAKELRRYTGDRDMDFREQVVKAIGQRLRQPIDANWLVPVIRSRNGENTIGYAPTLMRMYDRAGSVPALIRCVDFDSSDVRRYYNRVVLEQQLACKHGMAIPWVSDLNRDGTKEEMAANQKILDQLRDWLDHIERTGWTEPQYDHVALEKTWGVPVGNVKVRARVNTSLWPHGLPQVLSVDVLSEGGTMSFEQRPPHFEVEVNGDWYVRDNKKETTIPGNWNAYKGNPHHSVQLNESWHRKSDGHALQLAPGDYSAKVRLAIPGDDNGDRMIESRLVKFQVAGSSPVSADAER